jgi:hypothetical protein
MTAWRVIAGVLALLCASGAHAEAKLYRCGDDGSSFTDRPCPGGQALELRPAPSAERVHEAREVARRERLLAATLAAQRRARERLPAGLAPAGIRHASGLPAGSAETKPDVHLHPQPHRRSDPSGRSGTRTQDPRLTFQIRLSQRSTPAAGRVKAPSKSLRQRD